ncbi:YifB family Mg chelatase-like AAA ATPase [soil metagenome]
MISEVYSASTYGVDAYIIRVETHIESGLLNVAIVGLPDAAVKESRDRVAAAIKNSGLIFPIRRYTINLAPADIKKAGSAFDLPIAVGIITELGQMLPEKLKDYVLIGELSLDGKLRPVPGVLSIAIEAKKENFKGIIVPVENAKEAAVVKGLDVIPLETLNEVRQFLSGEIDRKPFFYDIKEEFESAKYYPEDIADVKGQAEVKRAMEVAAAGAHNIIMIGLPGSGKTMIARRLPSILPPITLEEALETTKIYSIAGMIPSGTSLVSTRPFRSPHHTASDIALVGGGRDAKPGEISFAHNGVLFLDEMTEFKKNVLEVMRQPLEDKEVTISRSKITLKYPCNFMLVAAMNPTPAGSQQENKMYSEYDIQKHISKISGPILDRIDIHIHVNPVNYNELTTKKEQENSETIRKRVQKAREIQLERYKDIPGLYSNANLNPRQIKEFCVIDEQCQNLLKMAVSKVGLSARAYDKILKLSRTIADMDASKDIKPEHISEAIQYRSLDRAGWLG